MNFRKNRRSGAPTVQMASLMDVVFLLLCFFMSVNEFSRWEKEVGIALPTAQEATIPKPMPGEIVLNLKAADPDRKGASDEPERLVTLNGQHLSFDEVTKRLKLIAKQFPGQAVVIRADKAVPYERFMELIDACRAADVWNFSLATEDPDKGK